VPVNLSTHLSHERKSLNWCEMPHSNLGNATCRADNLAERTNGSTTRVTEWKGLTGLTSGSQRATEGHEELRRDQSNQHRRLGQLKNLVGKAYVARAPSPAGKGFRIALSQGKLRREDSSHLSRTPPRPPPARASPTSPIPFTFKSHTKVTFSASPGDDMKGRGESVSFYGRRSFRGKHEARSAAFCKGGLRRVRPRPNRRHGRRRPQRGHAQADRHGRACGAP